MVLVPVSEAQVRRIAAPAAGRSEARARPASRAGNGKLNGKKKPDLSWLGLETDENGNPVLPKELGPGNENTG
jgi:hypothetical protein